MNKNELEEVWVLFKEDGNDHLDSSEENLLILRDSPEDKEALTVLFRAIHTYKGMARMMGLTNIEKVSHALEDLIGQVRDNGVLFSDEIISTCEETIDVLRDQLQLAITSQADPTLESADDILNALNQILKDIASGEDKAPEQEQNPDESTDIQEETQSSNEPPLVEEAEPIEAQPNQESISQNEESSVKDNEPSENSAHFFEPDGLDVNSDPAFVEFFLEIAEKELLTLNECINMGENGQDINASQFESFKENLSLPLERMNLAQLSKQIDQCQEDLSLENLTQLKSTFLQTLDLLKNNNNANVEEPCKAPLESIENIPAKDDMSADISIEQASPSEQTTEIEFNLDKKHAPSTDPSVVNAFLETISEPLKQLKSSLDSLEKGKAGAVEQIKEYCDQIKHSAQYMNYEGLLDLFTKFESSLENYDGSNPKAHEQLAVIELSIQEEVATIKGMICEDSKNHSDHSNEIESNLLHCSEASSIFIEKYAFHLNESFEKLASVTNNMKEDVNLLLTKGISDGSLCHKAEQASKLLRAIYHACIFYNYKSPANLTVALEDLFARVSQNEMICNLELLDITTMFIKMLSPIIQNKETDFDEAPFEEMLNNARAVLSSTGDQNKMDVGLKVLSMLSLDQKFFDTFTPNNIENVSQSLQQGDNFYTVTADFNDNPEVCEKFMEWAESETVNLITSITELLEETSRFVFLLASPDPLEIVQHELLCMCTDTSKLFVKECTICEEQELIEEKKNHSVTSSYDDLKEIREQETLKKQNALEYNLLEPIGHLVTANATLQHLTSRIEKCDFSEIITHAFAHSNGNWQSARTEISHKIKSWSDETFHALIQLCHQFESSIQQCQDIAISLREESVLKLTDEVKQVVSNTAIHFNKEISLNVSGGDLYVDKSLIEVFIEPLKKLSWFSAAHSVEAPGDRQKNQKPVAGEINLSFIKTNDNFICQIEDDGQKLNEALLEEHVDLGVFQEMFNDRQGSCTLKTKDEGIFVEMQLPLTQVVTDGMVVVAKGIHYIVPIQYVRRIINSEDDELYEFSSDGGQNLLKIGKEMIPIVPFSQCRDSECHEVSDNQSERQIFIIVENGYKTVAYPIDKLIGQEQVLRQPLRGYLQNMPGVSGCALLGRGVIGMILDSNTIAQC